MVCEVYGLYGVLEFTLRCEIAARHDRYGSMDYCGVNKPEYLVHLVHRLSASIEFLWCV